MLLLLLTLALSQLLLGRNQAVLLLVLTVLLLPKRDERFLGRLQDNRLDARHWWLVVHAGQKVLGRICGWLKLFVVLLRSVELRSLGLLLLLLLVVDQRTSLVRVEWL